MLPEISSSKNFLMLKIIAIVQAIDISEILAFHKSKWLWNADIIDVKGSVHFPGITSELQHKVKTDKIPKFWD